MTDQDIVDWKRITAAIHQQARKLGKENNVEEVVSLLREIVNTCGPFSKTRRSLSRIGITLLSGPPRIVAPICPDYSHRDGKYTFVSLGDGVPLLASLHIAFLKKVMQFLPNAAVTLLIADHEADNPELCAAVRKTRDAFRESVKNSVHETRCAVAALGFQVEAMTSVINTLVSEEESIAKWIGENPKFESRIWSEMMSRSDMYRKISFFMPIEDMKKRTVYTAAQYVALGRFAAANGFLVCNHTTTNLSWYYEAGTGVLHNPVSIY